MLHRWSAWLQVLAGLLWFAAVLAPVSAQVPVVAQTSQAAPTPIAQAPAPTTTSPNWSPIRPATVQTPALSTTPTAAPAWSPSAPVLAQPVVVQQGPGAAALPPPPPPLPEQYVPPPPPPPFADPLAPAGAGSPYLKPIIEAPGLFGSLEIGLVAPQINGVLTGPVSVAGFSQNVRLTSADLGWTGSPRIQLGYRFPQGAGAILGTYRSVVSEGTQAIPHYDPFGSGFERTRLNLNSVDIDYASATMPFAPLWDLKWYLGARIGAVYYDHRADGQWLHQRAANNFVGAGPHVGLDVHRQFADIPGLSLYGRTEGAVLLGNVHQSFEEIVGLANGPAVGGARNVSNGQSAPVFDFQIGLSYAPPTRRDWLRFTFGYQFEQWWNVGNAGGSTGDVFFQGLFFRGEFNY